MIGSVIPCVTSDAQMCELSERDRTRDLIMKLTLVTNGDSELVCGPVQVEGWLLRGLVRIVFNLIDLFYHL